MTKSTTTPPGQSHKLEPIRKSEVTQLVAALDDAYGWQSLDVSMASLDRTKKGTKMTFWTDQDFDMSGTKKIGLVLWFDREDVKRVQKELFNRE